MKHVRASEARRRWFELLDEVIAGEEVVVERKGHRIVIRAEGDVAIDPAAIPDYSSLLRGDVDEADTWTWEWTEEGTRPKRRSR